MPKLGSTKRKWYDPVIKKAKTNRYRTRIELMSSTDLDFSINFPGFKSGAISLKAGRIHEFYVCEFDTVYFLNRLKKDACRYDTEEEVKKIVLKLSKLLKTPETNKAMRVIGEAEPITYVR